MTPRHGDGALRLEIDAKKTGPLLENTNVSKSAGDFDIATLLGFVQPITTTAAETTSARSREIEEQWKEIFAKIEHFHRDAGLRVYDLEPPAHMAVNVARGVISKFRDYNVFPSRTTVDGEGGIAFEFEKDQDLIQLLVEEDGALRLIRFDGARLVFEEYIGKNDA